MNDAAKELNRTLSEENPHVLHMLSDLVRWQSRSWHYTFRPWLSLPRIVSAPLSDKTTLCPNQKAYTFPIFKRHCPPITPMISTIMLRRREKSRSDRNGSWHYTFRPWLSLPRIVSAPLSDKTTLCPNQKAYEARDPPARFLIYQKFYVMI
jgi:hypothetical protein